MSDPTEDRAKAMHLALTERGVTCFVHWDRSPWGVRIPLTDDEGEFAPALFVLIERQREVVSGQPSWVWDGQLGGFDDELLLDTHFEWVERPWLGHAVEPVADAVAALVRLLKAGTLATPDAIIESPSAWSYRASQENGDQVDCRECGNALNDDLPIVNDKDGYAYHEGCLTRPNPPRAS